MSLGIKVVDRFGFQHNLHHITSKWTEADLKSTKLIARMDNLSVKRNGGEEFRSRLRTFLRKESLLRSERVYTNVMKVRRVQKNVERTAQVTSIPHKMSAGYLSYDFEEAEDDLVFKDEGISKLDDATRQDVVDILGDNMATKPSHKRIRTLKVQFSFNSSGDPIADRVHNALRRASDSIIVNGTYQVRVYNVASVSTYVDTYLVKCCMLYFRMRGWQYGIMLHRSL